MLATFPISNRQTLGNRGLVYYGLPLPANAGNRLGRRRYRSAPAPIENQERPSRVHIVRTQPAWKSGSRPSGPGLVLPFSGLSKAALSQEP